NIAARKMEERINKERDNYALASYAETRSRAIWETDQAWARPVRKFGLREGGVIIQDQIDAAGTARINAKLQRIIIPRVEFKDATIREAVDYLKRKSIELDTTEPDQTKRGVNIVLKLGDGGGGGGIPTPAPAPESAIPGLPTATAGAEAPVNAGINPGDARITISLTTVPLAEALKYV